jgi:glycosyltransferase involved in cell wall biosynthesis
MHVGVEATTLRSQELGGVWRYTDGLINALGTLPTPHRYSLLFLNAFKARARVAPPRVPPALRLVEVGSVSNLLFTYLVPMMPVAPGIPTVESFLGPVDVFHSVNAVLLPQRSGRRVVTVHDLTCIDFPRFHPLARRVLFRAGLYRAARLADAIIVPSAATRSDLQRRVGSPRAPVHVVPSAAGARFVPLATAEAEPVVRRYGLAFREYLLFVGNVEPRKNLVGLLRAYDSLRRGRRHGPALVIAGGAGWRNRAILDAMATSAYTSDIRIVGYVPDEELAALMNGAIAFVYPSLYEGFGLPPLEAMACGTPVITSNRSSLPEVVGNAALLVDPEDTRELALAMARLVDDAPLREELRERGLERARAFSWQQTAELTSAVYESVVAAGRAPPQHDTA